jgi:hypothetical protein
MARYYFLLTSLPPLEIGQPVEMSFEQLKAMLELNLTEEDMEKVRQFISYIDLRNLRALWMKEPLDPRGSIGEKQFEEALLIKDFLPSFVFDFLDRYETVKDRLHYFSYLYFRFFNEQLSKGGFLEEFFKEEKEMRLIMTALRAKEAKRDILKELQFEDPNDPLVMQILSQKDMDDYEPPRDYERIKAIYKEFHRDPKKLALAFLEYRFETILELESRYPMFSIDQLLGYMARLFLVENWNALDERQGKALINSLTVS